MTAPTTPTQGWGLIWSVDCAAEPLFPASDPFPTPRRTAPFGDLRRPCSGREGFAAESSVDGRHEGAVVQQVKDLSGELTVRPSSYGRGRGNKAGDRPAEASRKGVRGSRAATRRAATRVNPEQAPKDMSRTPTRRQRGRGRIFAVDFGRSEGRGRILTWDSAAKTLPCFFAARLAAGLCEKGSVLEN
jgi:hypothetical protein